MIIQKNYEFPSTTVNTGTVESILLHFYDEYFTAGGAERYDNLIIMKLTVCYDNNALGVKQHAITNNFIRCSGSNYNVVMVSNLVSFDANVTPDLKYLTSSKIILEYQELGTALSRTPTISVA